MAGPHDPAERHRLPRLDSLRGIGALMVAGYHAGVNAGPSALGKAVTVAFSFAFDGRTGVSLFFVLSGLVLGQSLRRGGPPTLSTLYIFIGRRFFRLYPAYFATTMPYLGIYLLLRHRNFAGLPTGNGWLRYNLTDPTTSWQLLAENFCFAMQNLNPATWTLKVEVFVALGLPLLHIYSLRFRGRGEWLMLLGLIAVALNTTTWCSTRESMFLFYLGYLIPPALEWLHARRGGPGPIHAGWGAAAAIVVLLASHILPASGILRHIGILIAGIGSTLLLMTMLLAPTLPIFSFLDWSIIRRFGKVSFGFYLLHLACIDIMERLVSLIPGIPHWVAGSFALFPLMCLACAGLSWIVYDFVERPAIQLGGMLFHPQSKRDRWSR